MQKLPLTILGIILISEAAMAVNKSTTDLGQVALIPYYTVQAGNETLIAINNTTDNVKAVRIAFRESQNGREVLGFHLYLSSFDMWTAKITATSSGAELITYDRSCTVPMILGEGVEFRSHGYWGDGGSTSEGRVREGYVEIIEMGVVVKNSAAAKAATHGADGIPENCFQLLSNWNPGGVWDANPDVDMRPPTGGMSAEANIINVSDGVEYSEAVTILDNFYSGPGSLHSAPGAGLPSLSMAQPLISRVITDQDQVVTSQWPTGTDAVSAILMSGSIMNNYSINPNVNAETSLVLTFPTKHFYNSQIPVQQPFSAIFDQNGACEPVMVSAWNREQKALGTGVLGLCYQANVINFESVDGTSDVFGARWSSVDIHLGDTRSGWMEFDFSQFFHGLGNDEYYYEGLPVIGFSATRLGNANVGVGAAYASTAGHRYAPSLLPIVID